MEPLFGVLVALNNGTSRHGEWVLACLRGAWPKLVGDRLASVCHPAGFSGAELILEVGDPDWEKAVSSIKDALVARLNEATRGLVKTVSLRVKAAGSKE